MRNESLTPPARNANGKIIKADVRKIVREEYAKRPKVVKAKL